VARLYGQSAFFRFAIKLLQDVPDEEQRGFASSFTPDTATLDRFWKFVKSEKMLNDEALDQLRSNTQAVEDVGRGIHIEVLNATLGLEAGYRVAIRGDNQVAAAIEHLLDAEKMWQAWEESGEGSGVKSKE